MSFAIHYRVAAATSLTLAGATVPLGASAHAQEREDNSGLYVTARAGVALPSDFDLSGIQDPQAPSPGTAGAPANISADLESEVITSGAIGYRFNRRLFNLIQPSFELEYSYAKPNVDSGSFNGGNQQFFGEVEVHSVTVNYQSDFILSENQRVTPFVGGGIGIGIIESNIQYFPSTTSAPTFGVTDTGTAVTFQSNAGVRFDLSETIAIDARVRYQRINGVDLERRFIAGGNDAFNANVSGDYETVNLLAGIRYTF